ncbi:hypothetical protein C1I12_04285 [Listeria monocytogenes]|uniref:DUF262 domain-containing protein n=1 Tax=Listeria monocytogenes TaxID=1639 RepID=UPI000C86A0DC|nr:DUF262 domain-containing protein [Listeria monocytogenes]EAK8914869.1 DUF262 domain-containing protein [Listeria monocytogenes]EAK8917230.1 DUF262 domain-containing protein [Listeria monocytogenes]EHH9781110.1 DUF262 domain-containing protein [Listeria monocytogenes]EHH9781421.1 DUF262 domain-containing protein [Listeria monocytogenes]EJL5247939.1 DUF262 domain-containing protein [Listeria monocytogenes]
MNSEKSDIKLETKLVGSVDGKFYIPSYQRGYRWEKDQVYRLLDDIYTNGAKSYCLQPVVVRKLTDRYELIDGQQRLTTLYILLKYIQKEYKPRIKLNYSLNYETRTDSEAFLDSVDEMLAETNIDFFYIYSAYRTIDGWFKGQKDDVIAADKIYEYLAERVKIIWYEVDESEDAIALFTRLNIGKIPLTSAELVKAMFLSRDNNSEMDRKKQEEVSLQWDNIEKELHNNSLWYFLTNRSNVKYQTRIDLILDLISGKSADNKEKYYTFFYFDDLNQKENLNEIWKDIQHTFLILKDWYEDHELYHKIGYLIASNTKSLQDIFAVSKRKIDNRGITKKQFKSELDDYIKKSIAIRTSYSELSYEKTADYSRINKLLLLFNVESVRQNGEQTHWFPFEKFKYQKTSKVTWSLEHIHAQQSEGMQKQDDWKEWLRLHLPSIVSLGNSNDVLVDEIKNACDKERLERQEFEDIQQKVIQKLSAQGNTEYMHSIANLALLNMSDNAALNNSTFDVKRNAIIEMDKRGQFIPFCTKMVFLKYYTPSDGNQLHFWGQSDRIAYIKAINSTLKNYLAEEISIEKEAE